MKERFELYNGDCLEIMKQIPDKSVDMTLIDPPYGMSFRSNRRKDKYDNIKNDNDLSFLEYMFCELDRVLKDNTHIYVFCSWHHIDKFKIEFEKRFKLKNIIVWEKNNHTTGDLKGSYAPKHEFVLFGHKGRRLRNGYRYPDVLKASKTGNKLHPTQKPVDLLELFIEQSTSENNIVLDCFMGSGSTSVACMNTGRRFVGIELEEKYFDIAKERIKDLIVE